MEKEFVSQTALDQMVGSDTGQLMKAMIPYLPPKGQQMLSVYTKARELSNTLAIFSSAPEMQICEAPQTPSSPIDMLDDIRRFCYGDSRRKIDQMVNVMSMLQMIRIMNDNSDQKG